MVLIMSDVLNVSLFSSSTTVSCPSRSLADTATCTMTMTMTMVLIDCRVQSSRVQQQSSRERARKNEAFYYTEDTIQYTLIRYITNMYIPQKIK